MRGGIRALSGTLFSATTTLLLAYPGRSGPSMPRFSLGGRTTPFHTGHPSCFVMTNMWEILAADRTARAQRQRTKGRTGLLLSLPNPFLQLAGLAAATVTVFGILKYPGSPFVLVVGGCLSSPLPSQLSSYLPSLTVCQGESFGAPGLNLHSIVAPRCRPGQV